MEIDPEPPVEERPAKKLKMDSRNNLKEDLTTLSQIKHYKKMNEMINTITKKSEKELYLMEEIKNFLNSQKDLITLKEKYEKAVFVNLINFTKSNELIIKILNHPDDQLISNVFRTCKYFFQDSSLTPEFYIDHVFQKISYSNRIKLLKIVAKESKSTSRCDKFYETMNQIYDENTAMLFLPYCSEEFILDKLHNGKLLSEKQLLEMKKRNSQIVINYLLEFLKMHVNSLESSLWNLKFRIDEYENVIVLLMPDHFEKVLSIIQNGKNWLTLKLGRRSSKRIVKNSKSTVLSDPKYFDSCINTNILHRYTGPNEFEIFFRELWPKELKYFECHLRQRFISNHIRYFKDNKNKLQILVKIYNNLYNEDLLEISKISPDVMLLLPHDDRIKFTKLKLVLPEDKYLTPVQWTKFLNTELSVQKYMEEIYITNDEETRGQYIGYMIESCAINDDYEAVIKILKYINRRHRNEMLDFRLNLFSSITTHLNLDNFNENHWNEILELFEIISVNEEFGRFYYSKKLFIKALEFAIKKQFNLEKTLTYYLKWAPGKTNNHEMLKEFFEKNPELERKTILLTGNLLPKIEEEITHCAVLGFYNWICSYNKFNVEQLSPLSVTDFEWAIVGLEKLFVESSAYRHFLKGFYACIKYDKKAEKLFHPKLRLKYDTKYFDEILEYNFDLIKENRAEIAKACIEHSSHYIWRNYRKLIQIDGMEDLMRSHCKQILMEPQNRLRNEALRFLSKSSWLNDIEFYEFARQFYPLEAKPENEKIFSVQKEILYCMKYYKYNPEALKVLKLFCRGDFLKISLGALYHICTKLPYDIIKKFLSESMNAPVSFKKHLIRIQLLTGNHDNNVIFLRNMWQNESNPTIREVLMGFILTKFINIDNEFIWKIIQTLTVKDRNIIDNLCSKIYKIPNNIQSQYVENCWNIVCKLSKEEIIIAKKKDTILNAVHNLIDVINSNFVEKLLHENLFHDNNLSFIFIGIAFVLKKNEMNRNFDILFDELKLAIVNHWNDCQREEEIVYYPVRRRVNTFMEHFFCAVIDKKINQDELLNNLRKLDIGLMELFKNPEINICSNYWTLKIEILFLKSNSDFSQFGKQLKSIIDNVFQNSPVFLLTKFLTNLQDFIKTNKFDDDVQKLIAMGILATESGEVITESCALTALYLVGVTKFINDPELYNKINLLQYHSIQIELGNIK